MFIRYKWNHFSMKKMNSSSFKNINHIFDIYVEKLFGIK